MHDYLIVGAGLVGQLLARALARRGQRVCLAHDPAVAGASRVAAWMINPVTGIRFVPSWRVDEFLPVALDLFRELELESGRKIWHSLPVLRLFQGEDEWPRWEKKRLLAEVSRYVEKEFVGELSLKGVSHHRGGIYFKNSGWADLGPWLMGNLANPPANVEIIERRADLATPFSGNFRKVIFCTGYSPLPLPWKPAKGELLTVHIPGLNLQQILLRGIFVIPLGDDFYRVGATYEWDDLIVGSTDRGVRFLTEKLAGLITLPFKVVDAQSGIRPILQDARPAMGFAGKNPRIGICNGFGSKAALMAPFLTAHFADHLVHGTALDASVDAARLERK